MRESCNIDAIILCYTRDRHIESMSWNDFRVDNLYDVLQTVYSRKPICYLVETKTDLFPNKPEPSMKDLKGLAKRLEESSSGYFFPENVSHTFCNRFLENTKFNNIHRELEFGKQAPKNPTHLHLSL